MQTKRPASSWPQRGQREGHQGSRCAPQAPHGCPRLQNMGVPASGTCTASALAQLAQRNHRVVMPALSAATWCRDAPHPGHVPLYPTTHAMPGLLESFRCTAIIRDDPGKGKPRALLGRKAPRRIGPRQPAQLLGIAPIAEGENPRNLWMRGVAGELVLRVVAQQGMGRVGREQSQAGALAVGGVVLPLHAGSVSDDVRAGQLGALLQAPLARAAGSVEDDDQLARAVAAVASRRLGSTGWFAVRQAPSADGASASRVAVVRRSWPTICSHRHAARLGPDGWPMFVGRSRPRGARRT